MKLEQLFLKDITRNIEGVIKADDTDSLLSEVEEYVLTNEVAGLVETFLMNIPIMLVPMESGFPVSLDLVNLTY